MQISLIFNLIKEERGKKNKANIQQELFFRGYCL